ncbi:PIN domain-containing protein [Candidatus Peregrinibacteria bacterium]|nr:PIN domain-containing protein [Candidatus Peregrinibacteria bacterium]
MILIDTHVVIWLYSGEIELFSEKAKREIQENELVTSPIIKLELQYLFEIKKISRKPNEILAELHKKTGLRILKCDFAELIEESLKLNWTRDPFDRLIVAQSLLTNIRLLTKDQTILKNHKLSFWE